MNKLQTAKSVMLGSNPTEDSFSIQRWKIDLELLSGAPLQNPELLVHYRPACTMLGILHVIFPFLATALGQNIKMTWEITVHG